ncbi:MAG TPA: hypothetical protein PK514_13920 [Spirochaetota bacterium]|nr:hypothetical protein [Spirochaetota bacterium]
MKRIFKSVLYIGILLSVFAAGCEYKAENNDYYNFTIIGNGDSFHGSYKIDNESVVNFLSEQRGDYYHVYEKNLTSPGVITVTADGNSNLVTSLRIYIYQGSEVVASASKYQVDNDPVGLELTYTFNSSDTSTK